MNLSGSRVYILMRETNRKLLLGGMSAHCEGDTLLCVCVLTLQWDACMRICAVWRERESRTDRFILAYT